MNKAHVLTMGLRQRIRLPSLGSQQISNQRLKRYFYLVLGINGFLWFFAILYLLLAKPVYTSKWAVIIPVSTSTTDINLPDIGQAASSSGAGAGSSTYDIRANYEYIFTSEQVINDAATLANLNPKQFSKPKIKLIDNTTLMQFELTGATPEEARSKSIALYRTAQRRLNELREGEMKLRDVPTEAILRSAQKKLEEAQRRVSNYRFQSGLSSTDQVTELSKNIEQLRLQKAEVVANEQSASRRLNQLAENLGLSPSQAADAFQLQVDQPFQQYLKDYSESTTTLRLLLKKFGNNNPRVLSALSKQRSSFDNLLRRGRLILGRDISSSAISKLSLSTDQSTSGRDSLFSSLVNVQAEQRGLLAKSAALHSQISLLEQRLNNIAKPQSRLEALKRDEQIAEAVFASTLTKLDLGQGDLFSAYPLIQIAVEPTLPDRPSSPKTKLVLAGAGAASTFLTLGLFTLWHRNPWIKNASAWISK
jgi:uncharacterized protein involved in exopolysaccharide biosynthesis